MRPRRFSSRCVACSREAATHRMRYVPQRIRSEYVFMPVTGTKRRFCIKVYFSLFYRDASDLVRSQYAIEIKN